METDGYHLYQVEFVYRQKTYYCEFHSTAEITEKTDPLIAWGIADYAIKEKMQEIPDRKKGIYPHGIILRGDFGGLTIKK